MPANRRKARSSRGGKSLTGKARKRSGATRNRRARKKTNSRAIEASLQGGAAFPRLFNLPDSIPLTWLKFGIGLLIAPLCWITTEAALLSFARVTLHAEFWRSTEFWFFSLGSLMCLLVFFGVKGRALLFLYVLGHESTHAFFALLCGARIERVSVSADGGHILTDKNNVLISLSPYFVPFYTVLLLAAYTLAGHFLELNEIHFRILFALIGVTWTFHLAFTVWMILKNQPDLRQNGTFFSLTLIYLVNLLIIAAMFIIATPHLTWRDFTTTWLVHAHTLVPRFIDSVRELAGQIW